MPERAGTGRAILPGGREWDVRPNAVPYPEIDSAEDQIMLWIGRKRSGKSRAAGEVTWQWPTDRIVMDISRDFPVPADVEVTRLPSEPPFELPARRRRDVPETFLWQPDLSRATLHDDIDRIFGLAVHSPRRVLVVVDEAGVAFQLHKIGPNGTTIVHQNRHFGCSLAACFPRPRNIEPLLLSQADRFHMFDVPNRKDVEHLAGHAGLPMPVLEKASRTVLNRGDYWSLCVVQQPKSLKGLYACPPLPLSE